MWLIFIIACIVVALAALLVIYIGNKIIKKIERDDKASEVEDEAYEQAKKMTTGFICVNSREDNVRIEPMHMVFRFPQEDEI